MAIKQTSDTAAECSDMDIAQALLHHDRMWSKSLESIPTLAAAERAHDAAANKTFRGESLQLEVTRQLTIIRRRRTTMP